MTPVSINKQSQYIYNHCSRYLARSNNDARHNFGQFSEGDPAANISESWRFPIIDNYSDGQDFEASYGFNEVTFIYVATQAATQDIAVIGSFANLYEAIPLQRVENSDYYALTLVIPKGQVHRYKFLVNGEIILDPINPQLSTLDNGQTWSRFFTHNCTTPISFERWEMQILDRLTDHILPFHTEEGRNFLNRYYASKDNQGKTVIDRPQANLTFAHAYRLDKSVGVVNYIDKLVAAAERHYLDDYHTCLAIINQLLRQQNPVLEVTDMPKIQFIQLYDAMASNFVENWPTERYASPSFFLKLLRRHTLTGAFSHPKYGGNNGAASWAFLEERYTDENGKTLFDWRRSVEKPLGNATNYHG
ncbi:MAG: hypothetical protein GQ583_07525 [Methyloprofundus sp.]|nr:hypothetical protein [Methyloprofundus sp.]